MFLLNKTVADVMVKDVLTCKITASIRSAAKQMTERAVASIVVINEFAHPIGIVTDSDLRAKVLVGDYGLDAEVGELMSHPLHTVAPDTYLFDALLTMSHHDISHLIIVDGGCLVGVISDHDLQIEAGASPLGLIADIDRTRTVTQVAHLRPKIENALETLLVREGSMKKMVKLATELNDRITLKLLRLTEADMEKQGLSQPPTTFLWMALGSEGRREQTLCTDQDNALVFGDVPAADKKEVKKWFLIFSEKMVNSLMHYGFPRCPGGIMASNPKLCQSESEWVTIMENWILKPDDFSLKMACIFNDFRFLNPGIDYSIKLRARINSAIKKTPRFLKAMTRKALRNKPPLGAFRSFVVEKNKENKNGLNLKRKGILPVVDATRVMALDLGITTTNTIARLKEIRDRGIIGSELYTDVREAYAIINFLRIRHHLDASRKGVGLDNFIDPIKLSHLERKMLKESFLAINRLHKFLQLRYMT